MERNYLPGTQTTRPRPTPTVFLHLRKWVQPVEQSIELRSVTEITNITQQLEQSAVLYLNNIVSRVIAQLTAKYGDGFVTLEGTAEGALKTVLEAGVAEIGKLAAGTATIGAVEIVGTSRTVLNAVITFSGSATHEVIALVTGEKIYITNLMFTVAGEVNLTLKSATDAISGAMDFGGADEPRGMVQHFGNHPLETAAGEAFQILASAAVQVSGYVTYFTE